MPISVLYEDAAIVVCEKPVGILSQGEADSALPALLCAQLSCPVFPVHRLDQAVGGVMVFAKTGKAAAALSAQVAENTMQKEYLAVLSAVPQAQSAVLTDLLFFDRRSNKSFVVRRRRGGVKDASLDYALLCTAQDGADSRALVRVWLHSGRTHQIRVQFASRKLPLLGDGKYGSRDNRCTVALWSNRLSFLHPETGAPLSFSLEPPKTFPWNLFL